jgi:hypothetical protein
MLQWYSYCLTAAYLKQQIKNKEELLKKTKTFDNSFSIKKEESDEKN